MWERHVPVGELYALSAFKQVRGRWILLCRVYGVAFVLIGVALCAASSVAYGAVVILFGVFMLVWPDILLRRGRTAIIRRAGGELVTLAITEDDLKVTSPNWSNSISWRMVRRVVERDERWLVYVTRRTAIPVPKSIFDEAEQARLRDFLTNRPPHTQLTADR